MSNDYEAYQECRFPKGRRQKPTHRFDWNTDCPSLILKPTIEGAASLSEC